jgi:hypothetical protein
MRAGPGQIMKTGVLVFLFLGIFNRSVWNGSPAGSVFFVPKRILIKIYYISLIL